MPVVFQPFPMLPDRAAQVWRHQPAYRRPRHFHEEPELNLVVKGCARIGVGDRVWTLHPGELVCFEPGQDHVLLDASPDLELFVMALRPELAARALGARAFLSTGKIELAASELSAIGEQASALGALEDRLVVERTLGDWFATLTGRPRSVHAVTRRAVSQLRGAPGTSGSLLARQLRAPQSRVSTTFHRDLGVRLVEYRARLRLMHFVKLVDSGRSLGHAALEADFGSYAQCHRVFQRTLGCGPREYFSGRRRVVDAAVEPDLGV